MSTSWNDPDREPIAPDSDLETLARLYRDHPPPEPSEQAWRRAVSRTQARLLRPTRSRWPLLLGLVTATAAATLAAVILTRSLVTQPIVEAPSTVVRLPFDEDDEPFPVATLGEIEILRMDPHDAERIAVGQPIMGSMEFVLPEDFDLVGIESAPVGRCRPRLQRFEGVPMLIVAHAVTDEEQP